MEDFEFEKFANAAESLASVCGERIVSVATGIQGLGMDVESFAGARMGQARVIGWHHR